jgi:PAB1-binding protein PBP1
LRNANAELNTLETLIHSNVPISKQTLANAADLGIDIREELRQIRKEQEMVESTNTQQNVTLENNPGKTIYKTDTDVSGNPTERRFKGQ